MKNYGLGNNNLTNEKTRKEWIKKFGDNLIDNLNSTLKLILLSLYAVKKFTNLQDKKNIFGINTYPQASQYMFLLEELKLVSSVKVRRTNVYSLTPKGNKLCKEILISLKRPNLY